MYSLTIKTINKDRLVETEESFLDVEFDITMPETNPDGAETGETIVVATRKLAFPLSAKTKEIKAKLAKYLETFTGEMQMARDNAEVDKANKNADNVINKLEGLTL